MAFVQALKVELDGPYYCGIASSAGHSCNFAVALQEESAIFVTFLYNETNFGSIRKYGIDDGTMQSHV